MTDIVPTAPGGHSPDDTVTFSLRPREVESFREILRQQALGDEELLRDAIAGREDPEIRLSVYDRLTLTRRLAAVVGLTVIDRRRNRAVQVERYGDSYVRVRLSAVWVVLACLLTTLVVYTGDRLTGYALTPLYIPVTAFTTVRYGRMAGLACVIGCAALFAATTPLRIDQELVRPLTTFGGLVVTNWLIRRDLF